MRITITDGDREYHAESPNEELLEEKFHQIMRTIKELNRYPSCLHCGLRFDIGYDDKHCCPKCAELHVAIVDEAAITSN